MYLRAFPKKVFNFVFIIWRVPWSAFEYHCLRTTVFNKAWLQSNPFESMWSLLLHHHKGASSSPSCSRWSPPSLSAQSPLLQRLHLSVALLWERSSGGWGSAAPSILHPLLSTCAAGQRWWSRPYFTWSKFLRHSYLFSLSSGFVSSPIISTSTSGSWSWDDASARHMGFVIASHARLIHHLWLNPPPPPLLF